MISAVFAIIFRLKTTNKTIIVFYHGIMTFAIVPSFFHEPVFNDNVRFGGHFTFRTIHHDKCTKYYAQDSAQVEKLGNKIRRIAVYKNEHGLQHSELLRCLRYHF